MNTYVNTFDLSLITRLVLAVILGVVIGLERELKKKPLGLKTSTVICVISCLITIVSIETSYMLEEADFIEIRMDPLRLAAQIVSGVGFLGAGVILRRDNNRITGLTTAAIVWGAAGIGIAVGAEFYMEAIAGVVLLLISVEVIPALAMRVAPKRLYKRNIIINVNLAQQESIRLLIKELEKSNFVITSKAIADEEEPGYSMEIKARVSQDQSIEDIYGKISNFSDVQKVKVSS